jgi:hypothetical protein
MFLPVFLSTSAMIASVKSDNLEKSVPQHASIANFRAFSILDLAKSTIAQFLLITLNIAISI